MNKNLNNKSLVGAYREMCLQEMGPLSRVDKKDMEKVIAKLTPNVSDHLIFDGIENGNPQSMLFVNTLVKEIIKNHSL